MSSANGNQPPRDRLTGFLAELFTPDRQEPGTPAPFACRPVAARSAEQHTVLGIFDGGIGLADLALFRAAMNNLAAPECTKVILDFATTTLSRSALGTLVNFAAAMHGNNKRLYLYRPSAQIRSELKKLSLTAFFSILDTEEDLIASITV